MIFCWLFGPHNLFITAAAAASADACPPLPPPWRPRPCKCEGSCGQLTAVVNGFNRQVMNFEISFPRAHIKGFLLSRLLWSSRYFLGFVCSRKARPSPPRLDTQPSLSDFNSLHAVRVIFLFVLISFNSNDILLAAARKVNKATGHALLHVRHRGVRKFLFTSNPSRSFVWDFPLKKTAIRAVVPLNDEYFSTNENDENGRFHAGVITSELCSVD